LDEEGGGSDGTLNELLQLHLDQSTKRKGDAGQNGSGGLMRAAGEDFKRFERMQYPLGKEIRKK